MWLTWTSRSLAAARFCFRGWLARLACQTRLQFLSPTPGRRQLGIDSIIHPSITTSHFVHINSALLPLPPSPGLYLAGLQCDVGAADLLPLRTRMIEKKSRSKPRQFEGADAKEVGPARCTAAPPPLASLALATHLRFSVCRCRPPCIEL